MDDLEYDPDYVHTAPPHVGPVIQTPDVDGALLGLRRNALAMRGGDFNPPLGRRLLLQYLGVCRLIPYASSYSFLEDARSALICHAMAVPNGRSLSDDDPTWPAQVLAGLVGLGASPCGGLLAVPCEHAAHFPDHLWYVYSPDRNPRSELLAVDYFSRTAQKSQRIGRCGLLSEHYERCECGRWHRRLIVF